MSIHNSRTDRARWRSDRRRLISALHAMHGRAVNPDNATSADRDMLNDLEAKGAIKITCEDGKILAHLGPNATLYLLALSILSRADNREHVSGAVTLELSGPDVQALELAVYGRPQA